MHELEVKTRNTFLELLEDMSLLDINDEMNTPLTFRSVLNGVLGYALLTEEELSVILKIDSSQLARLRNKDNKMYFNPQYALEAYRGIYIKIKDKLGNSLDGFSTIESIVTYQGNGSSYCSVCNATIDILKLPDDMKCPNCNRRFEFGEIYVNRGGSDF